MKGTKLWNQPRSPLIQGRSRRERPFWIDWLAATVCGVAVGAVAVAAILTSSGGLVALRIQPVVLPVLAGAAIGAAAGVSIANAFGWYPRWVGGGVISSLSAVLATVVALVF